MAFRSSAVTTSANAAACNLPAGIAVGDYMIAAAICDFTGITIPTPPTGWTLRSGPTSINGDGQTIWLYDRIADGNESSQRTFTFSGGGDHVIVMGAWSGRNTSAPRTFLSATTPNTGVNGSPVSVALTGGTAASGDDIAWVGMLDTYDGDNSWSFTPPSSYTERTDTSFAWSSLSLASRDNVSSGATGTITGTATSSGDSASWSGFVIGIAAAGGGASTLTCAQASFTLSGQAATLRRARPPLTATQASFTLTGQAASLVHARPPLVATQVAFTLTGQAAGLARGLRVLLSQASFAHTGQALTLRHGYNSTLAQASFTLTGQAAAFSRSRPPLAAGQASFTLSGQAATLTPSSPAKTLTAGQGSFAVSGNTIATSFGRKLSEVVGSFSLVGNAVVLTRSRPPLAGGLGTFTLTGQAMGTRRALVMAAGQASFAMSFPAVTLVPSAGPGPGAGNLTAWHGCFGPSMLQ